MKSKFFNQTILPVCCLLFFISLNSFAQERDLSKIRIGFQLQQVQQDLGFGLHMLSPTFLGNFRLKASYNINWLTHLNNDGFSTWSAYSSFNYGTRYQKLISNNLNIYAEGGPQILINPNSISSEKVNFGGYGLFGFEFFFNDKSSSNTSCFLELGASGNNSRADKVITKPKIANGFITSVGVRF